MLEMKNEKNYMGFLIHKIWHILKRFSRALSWAQTSYLWGVHRIFSSCQRFFQNKVYFIDTKYSLVFWLSSSSHETIICKSSVRHLSTVSLPNELILNDRSIQLSSSIVQFHSEHSGKWIKICIDTPFEIRRIYYYIIINRYCNQKVWCYSYLKRI